MNSRTVPAQDADQFPRLAFIVDGALVAQFFLLLQQGVKVRRRVGCSVEVFLREEIGAAPETIEKIQSIMLDGRPVDDIRTAVVHDGSTLALSAAMPGLVGATLRRGGAYASFRSGITYREERQLCDPGEGWVTIKLFNLLMAELGPGLLRKGVLVNTGDIAGLLTERVRVLPPGCSASLDGRPVPLDRLRDAPGPGGASKVLLTVSPGPADT